MSNRIGRSHKMTARERHPTKERFPSRHEEDASCSANLHSRALLAPPSAATVVGTKLPCSQCLQADGTVLDLNGIIFINDMFWIKVGLSFFVPCTSGLVVLPMPVLALLESFAGVA